ncbi:MAG: glycosyltransferase family 4 protein [Gemmatimonadota bacterium]|nr:glycosyltransferase family 4 protein [Gemmatimonadota bacterium]
MLRTQLYSDGLAGLLEEHRDSLGLCHFRDPWSGLPILSRRDRTYATVYEVNGLPSVELPYTYPMIAPETLDKIRRLEDYCLDRSDAIVVPAKTIKSNLKSRGVAGGKITVIPNGADLLQKPARPPEAPGQYLIYFGALQRWQGIDTMLRAFAMLRDRDELHLVICSSTPEKRVRAYHRLADKLELRSRVIWKYGLMEDELAPWRAHARLSLAPLKECTRNLDQGCSPLKILESMAAGVPVVASDLPAVRELVEDEMTGILVRADRPSKLARRIRVCLEYPERLRSMGEKARETVAANFTWKKAESSLEAVYRKLLDKMPSSPAEETVTEMVASHPQAQMSHPPDYRMSSSGLDKQDSVESGPYGGL